MRNLVVIAIVAATVAMASCGNKEQAITESQAKAKIDSLVGERQDDIFAESMVDLDRRISIEVKPKADSIFAAWQANPW